jgi:hypothetical protein
MEYQEVRGTLVDGALRRFETARGPKNELAQQPQHLPRLSRR